MLCFFTASQPVHSLGCVLSGLVKEHHQCVIVVNEHPHFRLWDVKLVFIRLFPQEEFGQRYATNPQSAGFCPPCQAKAVQDKWSCGAYSSDTEWLQFSFAEILLLACCIIFLQPVSKFCACKYTTVKMNHLPQTLLSNTSNGTEIIIVNWNLLTTNTRCEKRKNK